MDYKDLLLGTGKSILSIYINILITTDNKDCLLPIRDLLEEIDVSRARGRELMLYNWSRRMGEMAIEEQKQMCRKQWRRKKSEI